MTAILEQLLGAPVHVTELKHKPGRRRVVRATGSRRTAIVKVYESERAPVVAARLAALAAGPPEPRVPRVLHLDPARRLLVLSEVEGEPLSTTILAGDLAACTRVGRVLATWHRAGRGVRSDALGPHTFADEERILLERADGASQPLADAVRAELAGLQGAWPCPTVVHRDLYEEQILLGERVGLIDLDDAALGPPELDLGNLLAHIELLELRCDGDFWLEAAALLDGYDAPLDHALLDRCRRLTLLRLACIHRLPVLLERPRRARGGARVRIALHVPRASYLEPGTSGDPIFLQGLIEGVRKRGHEVEIVSRVDVRDYWRGRRPARRLLAETIAVRRRMRRFSPDAWLVYGPSATYPDLFGWWPRPKRYVLLATGIGKPDRMPRPWRWIFPQAHRRSLARADVVTVYRPKSRKSLKELGIADERIVVLPLASPAWESVPDQAEARRRLGLPLDAPVVLSVSRLPEARDDGRPWKTEMVLELLDAAPRLPVEAVLVHVGDGPGRERVEAKADRLGLNGRLRLAGAVGHDEAVWYFAACDFFAFPDLRDFPWLAVLEAQACGRPVVTTKTRSAEMTVDEGRTGLLAADRKEFESHLATLARDRSRCRTMGEAAREYVQRAHSMQIRVRQIEELLRGRG